MASCVSASEGQGFPLAVSQHSALPRVYTSQGYQSLRPGNLCPLEGAILFVLVQYQERSNEN